MMDPYSILGVSKTTPRSEIRKCYHNLVKKYHPDKHENETPEVKNSYVEKFKQVVEAWSILGDNESRAKYDAAQQKIQDNKDHKKRREKEKKDRYDAAKRRAEAKLATEQAKREAEIREIAEKLKAEKARLAFQAALRAQKAREAARKRMITVVFTVIGIAIVSIFVFILKDTKEPIKHASVKFEKDIPKEVKFAIQELADTLNFGTEDEIKSLTNGGIIGPNGFIGYGDLSSRGPINFIAEKVKLTDGRTITISPHSFILRKQNDTALSCNFYTINNKIHLKDCLWFEMLMQEDEGALFGY